MIPVFTHYLEPSDYGRLDILQTLADLLSIVLIMGLGDALFKFYGETTNKKNQRKVVSNIFGMCLFICLVSTIVLQSFAPLIAKLLPGDITTLQVRFISVSLSISGCLLIPLCWFRLQDQANKYFLATTGRVFLQAVLSIILLYKGFGVTGVMAAGCIASLFWTIKTSVKFIREYGVSFNVTYWKKFFLYGSPLILTGLAGFVLGSFDRWILADSTGPEIMAKYALAAKFGLLTALLLQPFDLWWSPKRFSTLVQKNGAALCAKNISIGLVLVSLSIIAMMTASPLAVILMTPPEYHDAIQYLPVLCALSGLHMATLFVNIGIFNVKVTKWPAIIDIGVALIAFIGYVTLIPSFGSWGAIGATTIALTIRFFLTLILSQAISYIPYKAVPLIGLLLITILSVLVISHIGSILTIIVTGTVMFITVCVYSWATSLVSLPQKLVFGDS